MDGRGRALDNVFVERLWRSVKYEKVYLSEFRTVQDARQGLDEYFHFYNELRSASGARIPYTRRGVWDRSVLNSADGGRTACGQSVNVAENTRPCGQLVENA